MEQYERTHRELQADLWEAVEAETDVGRFIILGLFGGIMFSAFIGVLAFYYIDTGV